MNRMLATLVVLLVGQALAQPPNTGAPINLDKVDKIPEIVTLDQVPGCYGSVRFDHRVHVQMSGMHGECRNCHHELPEDAKSTDKPDVRPCRECHEPASNATIDGKPGLRGAYHRQCLSCHRDWTHDNACGFCHIVSGNIRANPGLAERLRGNLQPRAEAHASYVYNTGNKGIPMVTFHHKDHTERFGIKCVECHSGNSCSECHGSMTARPVVNRQQTCYNCHSQDRCVTCHDLRERPAFDHAQRTGWWLRPGHASLACNDCHKPNEFPSKPVTGACLPCHAKRWGEQGFDHSRTGVALEGDHAYFECLDCHRGGNEQMLADCTKCHAKRPVDGPRRVGRDNATWWDDRVNPEATSSDH